MTTAIYKLPARFVDDHRSRELPENEAAIFAVMGYSGHRAHVEMDALAYDELMSDALYYATEMGDGGYEDKSVIASAKRTVSALKKAGRP